MWEYLADLSLCEKIGISYISILLIIIIIQCFNISRMSIWFTLSESNHYKTENWIQKKWTVLAQVIGYVGVGKSTIVAAITASLERKSMMRQQEVIENTKLIFTYLDFNKFDEYLYYEFAINESKLIDMFGKIPQLIDLFVYNDFLNNHDSYVLMEKYITAFYCRVIDRNMILSKDKMYSHNTGEMSYILDDDVLSIINGWNLGTWVLRDYQIVIRDENSFDRGSSESNNNVIKHDSVKQLFQLYRNIFEGTSYFINIQQDADDAVAQERRLFSTNLLVEGGEEVLFNSYLVNKLTKKYRNKLKWHYRRKWFAEKFRGYDFYVEENKSNSFVREQKKAIKICQDFGKSMGYKVMDCKNYKSCKNVGSTDPSTFEGLELWFPMFEIYGTIETHAYRAFKIVLMKKATRVLTKFKNKMAWAEEQIGKLVKNVKE